jgi:hypothetical protein
VQAQFNVINGGNPTSGFSHDGPSQNLLCGNHTTLPLGILVRTLQILAVTSRGGTFYVLRFNFASTNPASFPL